MNAIMVPAEKVKEKISRGERNIRWIERNCVIPEGVHVGHLVVLEDFQKDIIRGIYDNKKGLTRKAIVSFARKNAKTALVSFLLLLHLCGPEAKRNSQLVSTALSRDQASLLYEYAKKCAMQSIRLAPYLVFTDSRKMIKCEMMGTQYRALSADAKTNLGGSPIFAAHDECGQIKGPTSELITAIETGMGAHEQPLSIYISTQAATDGDFLSLEIDEAKTSFDPRTVLFLYTAGPELDIFSEEALMAANPAYGIFLNKDELLRQAQEAKRSPAKLNSFRNLVLNQRISSESSAIMADVWRANSGENSGLLGEDLDEELPVFGGLDLAETGDLSSFVAIQPRDDGFVLVKPFFFLPEEGLKEKEVQEKEPYCLWRDEGYLITTPGKAIDFDDVALFLKDFFAKYRVEKVGYDRWRWKYFRKSLIRAGFDEYLLDPDGDERAKMRSVFGVFGQGYLDMSPAWANLEGLLLKEKLAHGNHPVLTMCARNTMLMTDDAGNKKPSKKKSRGRIDGLVALTMAIGVHMRSNLKAYSPGKATHLYVMDGDENDEY